MSDKPDKLEPMRPILGVVLRLEEAWSLLFTIGEKEARADLSPDDDEYDDDIANPHQATLDALQAISEDLTTRLTEDEGNHLDEHAPWHFGDLIPVGAVEAAAQRSAVFVHDKARRLRRVLEEAHDALDYAVKTLADIVDPPPPPPRAPKTITATDGTRIPATEAVYVAVINSGDGKTEIFTQDRPLEPSQLGSLLEKLPAPRTMRLEIRKKEGDR